MRKDARPRPASRIGVAASLFLHGLAVAGLGLLAAREGLLGTDLRRIAVTVVPKRPRVETPKPSPKPPLPSTPPPSAAEAIPPTPKPEPAPSVPAKRAAEAVIVGSTRSTEAPQFTAMASAPLPQPSPVLVGFDPGGALVAGTSSDPHARYKGFVEYILRAAWKRPPDLEDWKFVAEIELVIDAAGSVTDTEWKRTSGNAAWDESVRRTLAATHSVGRPPPPRFPSRVTVRFDVGPGQEAPPP